MGNLKIFTVLRPKGGISHNFEQIRIEFILLRDIPIGVIALKNRGVTRVY